MEHTFELIRRAQNGDDAAKEQILRENSGLIWSVVRRFYGRGEQEDLYQIGAIGLLKCIEKFDFGFGVKFSTYAVPLIMGEIKRFLRDDGTIKVSRSLKDIAYKAKKLQEKLLQEENRDVSLQEMAILLDVEIEELLLALESSQEIESLYHQNSGENHTLQLIDKLADTSESEKTMERIALMEALERLDTKERQIIIMRYFQDRTQSDVARQIGLSQVQVSRIEKRVLSHMKEVMQ